MVTPTTKEPPSNNSFDALQQIPKDMDEPQISPQDVETQCNPKGKTTNTLVLEQIHPIPPSHIKDGEASNLEEGDAEMDLDKHDLAGVDPV